MTREFGRSQAEISDGSDRAFPLPDAAVIVGILALPFIVLYWTVPFISKHTIGNDYLNYWINMQMYLRFSLANGTFPLYAPGFNGGWTSSALTLGQMYHPISWIAAIMPGYWDGFAHQIGTLLRLISLGGTQVVIFLFLRRLRLAIVLAFILSFITVYNLRMLDMFRYAASLENYTAMLLLCTFIGWFYLAPQKRIWSFCVTVCSWLLMVGGHPQMAYIGFLEAAFVCILFPFYISYLLPEEFPLDIAKVWKYWFRTGFSAALGILLASVYTLPFYFEYMQESWRGHAGDFVWSCSYQETISGNLCNFFNPFFSDVCGAFGGSAIILPAMLLPLAGVFYILRIWPVLSLWAGCVLVFVLALGSNGHLYYYFWKYFPFAQSFRIPGRLNMVLPFMFMLILAWMMQQKTLRLRVGKLQLPFDPVALVAGIALILFIIPKNFDYSALVQAGRWVPARINKVPSTAMSAFFVSALISLGSLIIYRVSNKLRIPAGIVLALAVLAGTMIVTGYGTWISGGRVRTETFTEMQSEQRLRTAYRYSTGDWTRRIIEEHLKHTFLEPFLGRVCPKYQAVGSQQESYERLAGLREIDLVYVEGWSDPNAKADAANIDKGIDRVVLRYNSFNNVKFDVECAKAGFFVFSYPHSLQWQAIIDGQVGTIYRCNALEQGVWISAGRHLIEFRYRSPATIAGMMLGSLAIILTIWNLFSRACRKKILWLITAAVAVLCALLFSIWYHSLYSGGNIGTYYVWTSQQIQPNLSSRYNLAYGKKTAMSTEKKDKSYINDSSVGVDGQRDGFWGFITDTRRQAWWQVDLGEIEPIGEIVLYKMRGGYSNFGIPFDIMCSQDGTNWRRIETISTDSENDRWRIPVSGVKSRYIRLQTQRQGFLALSEVEVYK